MRRTHANGKVLISIDGLPITLIPFVPMKGLTADENVKIITALIVSDEVYSEYVNPDTVTVYHNFCIPSETVEADGLMVSIMEARDLLKPSGLYCESYLDNFGRQLFYVISGSYTTLYMGFMLLIIACALLALQFLTQMRETKARYATLSILGARRETNEAFHKPTGAMVFSAPAVSCVYQRYSRNLRNAALPIL